MPPKRAAAASGAVALSLNSQHDDVVAFLDSVLTVQQCTEVTDKWAENQMSLTGQVLLNTQKADLKKMGISGIIATKLEQHLKAARQAQAINLKENSPTASTPLVDGVASQEVDLSTDPGPSGPKPRGRGRPSKARQSRLSQRLEVAQMDEDEAASDEEEEEPAAPDDEVELVDASLGNGRTRHPRTRQRNSRLAAVQRAQARIKEVEDDLLLEDSDNEDAAPSDSESDDEMVPTRRSGRGRGARGNNATADGAEEVVEEEDTRPEEPDDGVHYRNDHEWEDGAREGLEDILKTMRFEELKHIVDEEFIEANPWHYYKYKTKDSIGQTVTKNRSCAFVAQKIVKMQLDGHLKPGKAENGGSTPEGIDAILDKYVPEVYVKNYLQNVLLKRYATPPKISETRRCLWRLWCTPVPKDGPESASLGQITFPVRRVGVHLREYWLNLVEMWDDGNGKDFPGVGPFMTTDKMNSAFKKQEDLIKEYEANVAAGIARAEGHGASAMDGVKPDPDANGNNLPGGAASSNPPQREILFEETTDEDPHDWDDLFEQLLSMQKRSHINIRWRLNIPAMKLYGEVVVDLKGTKGDVLVQAAYMSKDKNGQELVQIWLDKILQAMDHLQGSALLENDLEALNVAWDDSITDLETRSVELTLDPPNAVDIKIFDKIMAGVENLERPMEAGVEADCREEIALKLKPYQKRALSFMLREERAPGGTSRHLWLKVPLPGSQAGVECYMSPSLFQLYISKSPTATGIALGNTGGGGWQALEMGMGKTAVVIAGILFNPPPLDWRRNRPWTPYNSSDYMLTKTENMPRGGTLVVVPVSLIRQWEMEIVKTLKNPEQLSILRWTDARRTIDCNEIAKYDIVLTTPMQVTKDATLPSIYWHRVVVDEAQLNAGSMMQSGILISTHRWIVSGTPCNSHPETLRPSLEFLRLGGYSDAQRHLPPALATVMRAVMCRYTKDGTIDGERNLELRALVERTHVCELDGPDIDDEKDVSRQAFTQYNKLMTRGMKKAGCLPDTTIESLLANPQSLSTVTKNGQIKTRAIRTTMNRVRSVVAGGGPVLVPGEFVYNARKGQDEPATRFFQSKATNVVACLEQLRQAEPDAKVLVFSEFEENLRSIADLLPSIGLGYRSIFGGTSAKARGEAIELFMNDPPTKVFLLVARSAAVGITLTSANHVFICEPQMNPAIEAQAIGRSQRMGQEKVVTVHRMFTKDTIEDKVRHLIARRHGGPSAAMVSTAMAANPDAGELQCSLVDLYNLLKVDLDDSSDEEEEQQNDDDMMMFN